MADKYKNKYRISSARLQNWDYGWNAAYFVTINTKGREHFFGEIIAGKMKLSEIGIIAEGEWLNTFEMRPDMNLKMGEYVVMPNHFHAIIIIGKNKYNSDIDIKRLASTVDNNNPKNEFGTQSKNLASVIRGFKISVTRNARKIHADYAWQSRFHDHIIRNEESYNNIVNYILNNPTNWGKDKLYRDAMQCISIMYNI